MISNCLQSLGADEGAVMLLTYCDLSIEQIPLSRLEEAKAIVMEVGGLPLLIAGLAGYLSQSKVSFQEILAELKKSRTYFRRLICSAATASTNYQYEKPLTAVFAIALEALHSPARNVIEIMAMLSPDKIPLDVVSADLEEEDMRFLDLNHPSEVHAYCCAC